MAKILYLSCHSILEFEEVSLLHELGHEVFSPGAYMDPKIPDGMRPGIPGLKYDQDILNKYHAIGQKFPGEDGKDHLTKELVDCFDMVIVMHLPRWIQRNWGVFKDKRVIWRTIGQSVASVEQFLSSFRKQGLEVIRYSTMERNIPGFIGEDILIRFYKDPDQYKDWSGHRERVITFAQHMKSRNRACSFDFFESTTRPFDRHLFGPGNDNVEEWGSDKVSYSQLLQELRDNRAYFYTGTHPASYTLNFMEAWMTGIPVVAVGPQHGNASYFPGHDLYEIPYLIQHDKTGFVSDDKSELQKHIRSLFNSRDYAEEISKEARASAIKIFGKDIIKEQWREFLDG